jgi:hypothetical protein
LGHLPLGISGTGPASAPPALKGGVGAGVGVGGGLGLGGAGDVEGGWIVVLLEDVIPPVSWAPTLTERNTQASTTNTKMSKAALSANARGYVTCPSKKCLPVTF